MTGKRAEPYLRPSSRRIAISVAVVTPANFPPNARLPGRLATLVTGPLRQAGEQTVSF